MEQTGRVLRSATSTPASASLAPISKPLSVKQVDSSSRMGPIVVPHGSKLAGLDKEELALLRQKQARLQENAKSARECLPELSLQKALESTWIFAQYEAGTAVSVGSWWILTCAHCFGDTDDEYAEGEKRKWLLSYTGQAVRVECRVRDSRRDLALLRVIVVEDKPTNRGSSTLAELGETFIGLMEDAPKRRERILCIGQPGRDDLESTTERKMPYNLVEISDGKINGMVKGDPQDNNEIGKLMHDAWTYWGHSGAPLISYRTGRLIGLHSSWDSDTGMRHGVPLIAIRSFLEENYATMAK